MATTLDTPVKAVPMYITRPNSIETNPAMKNKVDRNEHTNPNVIIERTPLYTNVFFMRIDEIKAAR